MQRGMAEPGAPTPVRMAEPAADAPTPVRSFLGKIKLEQHREALKDAGYEDVDDFAEFGADDLAVMKSALADRKVPPGHVQKIVRAIQQRQQHQPAPSESEPHGAMQQWQQHQLAPTESEPHSALPAHARLAPLSRDGAEAVGLGIAQRNQEGHKAKVLAWLDSTAGRVIYGRFKPSVPLTAYHMKVILPD